MVTAKKSARDKVSSQSTAPRQRDLRIDFLRGLFIVSLGGSHFAWFAHEVGYHHWLRYYDIQPFGFSSPAEFFVFFSGYVMTLVLARGFDQIGFGLTLARSANRAWDLYILNVFTFAIVVGASPWILSNVPQLRDLSGLTRMALDPLPFIGRFLTFQDNVAFFEILRNYIFFLPLVAPFLWVWRRLPWAPLVVSVAVWGALQLGLIRAHYPTFNPFGWQLIFFLGATCAMVRPLDQWVFSHRRLQILLCAGAIICAFILRQTVFPDVPSERMPLALKAEIGPLRLVHFALLLWTAMLITPSSETLASSRVVGLVVKVGQHSLECFCLSSVMAYFCAGLLSLAPGSIAYYWTLVLIAMGALLLGAQLCDWFKSEPWRKKPTTV